MDSSLDLVPGRLQAAHCSWGVLEEGQSRMGKGRRFILFLITATSGAPQVLCRLHIFTCVLQCVPIKPDNYYIIIQFIYTINPYMHKCKHKGMQKHTHIYIEATQDTHTHTHTSRPEVAVNLFSAFFPSWTVLPQGPPRSSGQLVAPGDQVK